MIAARTVEWAVGDAHHDTVVLFPRNQEFTGLTPEGGNGLKWKGKHGFVSLMAYGQEYRPDGMNEAGLYVGMYYFPGFASFQTYDSAKTGQSLSVADFMRWLLSSFKTVAQVRANLAQVRVVNVEDARFGGAALPFHWKIADKSGACIIVEIVDGGKMKIYEAVLGVITNSPDYDWHITNLRNYLGLGGTQVDDHPVGCEAGSARRRHGVVGHARRFHAPFALRACGRLHGVSAVFADRRGCSLRILPSARQLQHPCRCYG